MEQVYLAGSEDVRSAGSAIRQAADDIRNAAGSMNEIGNPIQQFGEFVGRFENAMAYFGEIQGMIAENRNREYSGHSMAYGEDEFFSVAKKYGMAR